MKKGNQYFIIDFDSTFTKVEALDVLAKIVDTDPSRQKITAKKIQDITDRGMSGELSFRESLVERINILNAHRDHLPELIERLSHQVSKSFKRNRGFINKYKDFIYIISNGFKDFIEPIVAHYGIASDNVFANEFVYDPVGSIVGFNRHNLLSENNGKPKQIRALNLQGEIFVLGDGYTDYEIKKAGLAHKFYAFTENVRRESVLANADHEAPSLDNFLFDQNLERAHSYPKNRMKVLLLENIHPQGFEKLKSEEYQVESRSSGMTENELCEAVKDISILGIRSKTQVTPKVLDSAKRLMAIGAFCIGTNQVNLEKCLDKGIIVFNAPFSNTRSVVELAIAEIVLLMRNLPDKIRMMHEGRWEKSATGSNEMRGKMLGIMGYGKIGSQLSVVAESMGMNVQFYDIEEKLALGNAHPCTSMEDLLNTSDVVSIHVDGRETNKNLIGANEFQLMKEGVIFINLSRGHIVDIDALKINVENGKIHGVSVDVFPEEPLSNKDPFQSPLIGLKNTILTPHIGGSTQEAQEHIAGFVPGKIIEYINTGSTSNSVNFPNISLPELRLQNAHRFIHIHQNVPGVLAQINKTLAGHNINIVGQYLKTNEKIGYVITDIDKNYKEEATNDLKMIKGTIKFRVLY